MPILALWLAIFVVYGVGLRAPFIYDDVSLLARNPLVFGPWPGIAAFFQPFSSLGEMEPLVTILHWLIYRAAGDYVPAYRLSSLVLHAANASLLLLVYRRLLKNELAAACAAMLFALFPAHTEILAVSTFKKHLLVSLAGAAILYLQARPSLERTVMSWIFLGLGLMSKESALMLPWLALLVDRRNKTLHAGNFLIAFLYIVARLTFVPRHYPPPVGGHWLAHALTSVKCLLWSLSQLLLPWDLCLEHTLVSVSSAWSAEAVLLLGGLAAVLAVGRRLWRFDSICGLGLAWSLLSLLPFVNLVPFLNFSLVANRYLYFASAGFALAAARLLQRALSGRGLLLAASPMILAYGLVDLGAMVQFTDPLELLTRTARCAPANPRAHVGLALAYAQKQLYPQAMEEYRRAIALSPDFSLARLGQAEVLARTGNLAEAIAIASAQAEALGSAEAYQDLGAFHLQAREYEKAEKALLAAAARRPSAEIQLALGECRLAMGRLDEAQRSLLEALSPSSDPPERAKALELLGELYAKKGDQETAVLLYERSSRLRPLSAESALGLARLHIARKDRARAVAVLDEAIRRLDAALAAAKAAGRQRDKVLLTEAEASHARIKRERDRLAGR